MNIVIPITDKYKDKYNDLLMKLEGAEGIKVYVGIEEKNSSYMNLFEESKNIFVSYYADNSNGESIINSLQRYAKSGSTIVLRKPITIEELSKFMSCKHNIATCEIQRTKVKGFIFNLWQTILKFCLGIREYQGDTSVVFLNEEISAVVRESGNLSFSTRANRWRGVEETTISVKGESVKKDVDKKILLKYSLFASISLLLAIIVTTLVCCFVNVSVIIGLLIICLDMICLAVSVLTTIMLVFNCRVGKKKIDEAEEKVNEKEFEIEV